MNPYSGTDSFPDPVSEIENNDTFNAANATSGIKGALDRTRWLKNRTGIGRLSSQTHTDVTGDYSATPDLSSSWPVSWNDAIFTPANTVTLWTISHTLLKVNDLVELDIRGTMAVVMTTASLATGDIDFGYVANGGSYTGMGRVRHRAYNGDSAGRAFFAPFAVSGLITITDATQDILIQCQGRMNPGGGADAVGIDGLRDQFFRIWSAN